MTIQYSKKDQSDYYKERCFYLCLLAGIEPFIINAENVDSLEGPLFLTATGITAVKARHEISNILLFSETVGYTEE